MIPSTELQMELKSHEFSQVASSARAPQAHVIHSLKQWMNDGALSVGSLLPSERALSEELQVNRGTVRRALQVLQDEGFLRTQNGRTRIVTRPDQQNVGALRKSVALVAPLFTERPKEDHDGGRVEFIGRGALEGIRDIGKHAMSLHPENLTSTEVLELAAAQLFGVVITDIAMQPEKGVQLANSFRDAGTPVCVYGDLPQSRSFDRVISDQENGSYQLTQLLIARGCRRILNFWTAPVDSYWNRQRQIGYENAMREAGLEPLSPVWMPPFPETKGQREIFESGVRMTVGYLVEHLVGSEPVDGLLLSTDNDYFGVAAACRLCGKEPQRDVLIAGYDNYWFEDHKRQFEPTIPLATVDKRNRAMGQEMVQLLADRVAGKLPESPQRRVVQPYLVVT